MTELLSLDRSYLDGEAGRFIDGGVTVEGIGKLPTAIASRVVRELAPSALSQAQTESVLELVRSGEASGSVDLPGCRAVKEYDSLRFEAGESGDRGFEPFCVFDGFDREIPELGLRFRCKMQTYDRIIHKSFNSFLFKIDGLCGTITVRPRKVGDRLTISGRGITKTVKKAHD
jgi:hypothetical protein